MHKEAVTEIKFKVRDPQGKWIALEIFNQKFGWHHVTAEDAKEYGMEAPISMGTYPDKVGSINTREIK